MYDKHSPEVAAATTDRPAVAGASVWAEVRWAFTPPWAWLGGVAANLVLAAVWLLVEPIRSHAHRDWVVLVGTYFATFILADVTTTNILGVDAVRVDAALRRHLPLHRVILAKNAALLLIVGAPTLVFTVAATLSTESGHRLAVTVPNIALPILAWLGFGNLVSVVFPVAHRPLRHRWRDRRQVRSTATWLAHLVLPYALYYLVDPTDGPPRILLRREFIGHLGPDQRSLVHAAIGVAIWALTTVAALAIARRHGLTSVTTGVIGSTGRCPARGRRRRG